MTARSATLACSVLALTLLGAPARGAVVPHPGPGDPRVQSVDYDPEQVVVLRVAQGFALTLEFAPDERIENVSVGNAAVWQATPNRRADHLFVKPMQGATATDMTVVTDARRYAFELQPLYAPDPTMAYTVRFIYPAPATPPPAVAETEAGAYRFSGARALRPLAMSDDGRVTTIAWQPDAAVPAVFVLDTQGREALVNGAVRNGRYVVDGIAARFVFRLGDLEARAVRRPAAAPRP